MPAAFLSTVALLFAVTTLNSSLDGTDVAQCVEVTKQRLTESIKHLLTKTQLSEGSSAARAKLYIGIDEGDYFSTTDGLKFLEDLLDPYSIAYQVLAPFPPDYHGKLCRIWREMAAHAYRDGWDFTVLLGDDVTIQTYDWMDRTEGAYADLAAEMFTSAAARSRLYGFGCICFADESCPNFPSFPVLHRLHFEIMSEEIFPWAFENQDADPFVFEMYKWFNASRILYDVKLVNAIGGHGEARYTKKHINWKGEFLDDAVAKVRSYLMPWQDQITARSPSLDVVVPSFRCDLDILRTFCELPVANEGTFFIIIVDRPDEEERVRTALEKLPRVRVRANEENLGASASRNHGLNESAAEYVLFLDDDVIPNQDVILEYSKALQVYGDRVDGLVGMVKFPPMGTLREKAIFISGVSYMFGIAEVLENPSWGVTANLLLKRKPDTSFGVGFPKTGGGEDIDICLRYKRPDGTSPFRSCPTAIVTHPWWPDDMHFFNWARGDGRLMTLYPEHTYRNFPNVAESVIIAPFVVIAPLLTAIIWWPSTFTGVGSVVLRGLMSSVAIIVSEMSSDVIQHCLVHRTRGVQEIHGLTRVLAAARSSWIILTLEMGRLFGHFVRREWWNFTRRFDWHCGQMPRSVRHERVVAGLKVVMHVAMVALLQYGFTEYRRHL